MQPRRLGAVAVSVALLVSISACASNRRSTTVMPSQVHRTPDQVALQFTESVVRLRYDISEMIVPNQRRLLDNFKTAAGSRPRPKAGWTRDLRAGSISASGNVAAVVLIGSMCNAQARPVCRVNRNPSSSDRFWLVNTVKLGREWYVFFPVPGYKPPSS